MSADTTETQPAAPGRNGLSKKQRGGIVLLAVVALGAVLGLQRFVHARTHIETDNAFVESHVHSVSSRIPATVLRVAVVENQYVHKGDLLVELDPSDYRVREMSAAAALEVARNESSSDYAEVQSAGAGVGLAGANLEQANLDLKRGEALYAREVIPREQLDRLKTAARIAQMSLMEAKEEENQAKATVGMSEHGSRDARIAQKQAELEAARLNLGYTRIVAPNDGFVTRKGVEPGNYVQPGQALMAVVSLKEAWITANYKESQLAHVRPGQKVEFTVDSYPGRRFTGRVESIMAGTGAAFSLLPPENATGNYVKVTQRIPVRIAIDHSRETDQLLRVGMSVEPAILTGMSFGQALGIGKRAPNNL